MHSLALISVVDPLLADLTSLALHGEGALVLMASIHDEDDGFIRLSAVRAPGLPDQAEAGTVTLDVRPSSSCWTCSLRKVLLVVAEDRARMEPEGATVVLLPPGVELVHLAPRLAEDIAALRGVELAGLAHVIDIDTAAADLLTRRAPPGSLPAAQERCAGELHMVALGYADVVITLGRDPIGRDLVEHLRPHETLLLPGLDEPLLNELMAVCHDPVAAMARVHPATTRAWGGPVEHGVRTLDLFSVRPFHPGRLRALVEDLAGRGMLARGCFWLASRPGRVCAWEVAGGVVRVGDAGAWPDGSGEHGAAGGPRCHLVVTGVADDEACQRVTAAFNAILLRHDELTEALGWAGAPDGLEDWFG